MTRIDKITAATRDKHDPSPRGISGTCSGGVPDTLITMDARKVSGREFIDALGLSTPEQREARRQQTREQCIRAIEAGNTYGFPPVLVAECKEILAEREIGLNLPEGWNRVGY